MFVSHPRTRPARRGAILIVVLAMLALFAVLGLSFVLYADSQAGSARNNKIAENRDSPPDPVLACQQYLLTQLFDVGDTGDDLMNPLRGHSLARTKYGYQATFPRLSAFVGSGTLNETIPAGKIPGVAAPMSRTQIVNHTFIPAFGVVVDPERQTEGGTPIPFRGLAQVNTPPDATAGGNYVNKAAPYTYPDRNNFFLALMNPATGQVITPSYHREDLFGNLAPSNPNWLNPQGRLMTLRPRPAEHPNFPLPPPNADGTFTGDVSNLKFITGSQKNDSIWIDIGGPVLEWRGRKYKALVAPLILDLNSRINLSVAGNVRTGDVNPADVGMPAGTPNSYVDEHPRHTSLHGLGPWEVNPTAVFPNLPGAGPSPPAAWRGQNWELFALLRQRFPQPNPMPDSVSAPPRILVGATPQIDPMYVSVPGRIGHLAQPLGGGPLLGQFPPGYSRLDLDGVTINRPVASSVDPMFPPAAGGFGPFPIYPGTRFAADQNTYVNSAQRLHPSMFNPFQWQRGGATTVTSNTHPFGNDDAMKWLTRFTDPKGRFTNTNLFRDTLATMTAGGWGAPTNLASPLVHAATTLFSSSQQWAEIPVAIAPGAFVNLGPIDVNRPLADYRKTAVWLNPGPGPGFPRYEPVPHSPVNIWNPNAAVGSPEPAHYAKARLARQNLARDVFVRLVALAGLVDGTTIVYEPTSGYLRGPGNTVINVPALPAGVQVQLRAYAQFAANITDYVDADDISHAFVWNPANPLTPVVYAGGGGPVLDPATGLPFLDPVADATNFAPAVIGDRVVYGTELPRLVINEAYCVLENTRNPPENFPMGRASRPMVRRYWVELHNPLPADAAPSPLSDGGAARLQYEAGVTAFQNPANPAALVPAGGTYNPYRLEVAVAAPSGGGPATPYSAFLAANQANAVADTATIPFATYPMTLQARINSYTQDTNAPAPATPTLPAAGDGKNVVLPANGAANDAGTKNVGYYVIGPRDQFPAGSVLNSLSLPDPTAAAAPYDGLTFNATPAAPTGGDVTTERGKTSVVILRRLANPYLPPQENPVNPNYNPYVTVDYIENLPSLDRVGHDNAGTRTPNPGDTARPTIGRKHPYAAYPTYGTGTGSDGVQDQVGAMGVTPPHTLFSANSNLDNVAAGLPWLVHLDRQLVNSLELLHVSTYSPAVLTHKFYSERQYTTPAPGTLYEYQRHTTWTPIAVTAAEPLVPALRNPGWYKALDLLVCGNPMPGVPVGGREPGRMNPNTLADSRLLNAVLDPQPGNNFFTNPNLVTNYVGAGGAVPVWTALNAAIPDADVARTPNGVPRATVAESGAITGDRPFRSFAGSPDVQDSLLRTNRQVSTPTLPGQPVLFNNATATHPYTQAEPLRKMLNSLTPTSDSFLVVMTVGFFEVTNAGPHSVTNQPVLGKELFDRVPGDLRAQFAAVLDRSQLAVHHDGQLPGEGNTGAIQANVASKLLPVQMKLLRDATVGANQIVIEAGPGGTLFDNGAALGLAAGRLLRLGNADVNTALVSGASTVVSGDGEWVRIAAVAQLNGPDVTGAVTVPIPGHFVVTLDNTFAMAGGWGAGVVNRYHAAGTKVTTTVMGNPGPQTGITLEQLRQRGLVPYFTRIEP